MITSKRRNKIGFFYKHLIAVVAINILPLFIMSGLLYSNFIDDYKANLLEAMDSEIALLGATSRSALLFNDKQSATALLSSLEEFTSTRYAQIYDADMELFAEYKRPGQLVDMPAEQLNSGLMIKGQTIYLSKAVTLGEESLGLIVISANTKSLNIQKQRYLLIIGVALLASLILAYLLNWTLQKRLTSPISELISLVGYVAKNERYHKRLNNERDDEIGDLILGVNTMLDTIETHEMQLYNRAHYDELTQLPNRHLLMERLSHSIKVADRNQSEIALLFLDLDRFKIINDSLGHRIGDELLLEVAGKLVKVLRTSDSVSRWGGDEFVMLLEDIKSTEDIDIIVEKIITELAKPTIVSGHRLHVSTSVGIARFPQNGKDCQSLLKHADISMYHAKEQGVGKYCYFNSSMLNKSVQRLSMEMHVHKAFEDSDFFLVYQPQVSSNGEKLIGFEALIRWKLNGAFVPPNKFLQIIEDVGLMHQLSLWVLEEACTQNKRWQQAGFAPIKISINLPPSFIIQPQCLQNIHSVLNDTGLAPEYLEIELTENTFLGSRLIAGPILQSLKDLGISIAIDDFGTGYSCMSYLQDLPIGTLKIDGSFVKGLGRSQANEGIVRSIITLGKSLDMQIVAECVETEKQLAILKKMDCDIIQGYLFSKPLTAENAERYLASRQVKKGLNRAS